MKKNVLFYSMISTAGLYLLTSLHHAYGAWLYQTPWRMHIVTQGFFPLLIILVLYFLYVRLTKRPLLILYLLASFVFFGIFIGLYEGGYNHLVKNVLFYSGVKLETMRSLFPPPLYEMPNDFLFESSGILQFFLGVVQIWLLIRVFQDRIRTKQDLPILK